MQTFSRQSDRTNPINSGHLWDFIPYKTTHSWDTTNNSSFEQLLHQLTYTISDLIPFFSRSECNKRQYLNADVKLMTTSACTPSDTEMLGISDSVFNFFDLCLQHSILNYRTIRHKQTYSVQQDEPLQLQRLPETIALRWRYLTMIADNWASWFNGYISIW